MSQLWHQNAPMNHGMAHTMSIEIQDKLVIAISSRALFDLDVSHRVFVEEGIDACCRYQIAHEDDVLAPGMAFPLVKKLLALNDADTGTAKVEVILLSRNSADTGLRVFNLIRHHGLKITRAAFTRGESTHRYIGAFGAYRYLSASQDDVRKAIEAGCAAATILPSPVNLNTSGQLRIAFDGDAVLFSDESEQIRILASVFHEAIAVPGFIVVDVLHCHVEWVILEACSGMPHRTGPFPPFTTPEKGPQGR
jgi:5'-nucleotidase